MKVKARINGTTETSLYGQQCHAKKWKTTVFFFSEALSDIKIGLKNNKCNYRFRIFTFKKKRPSKP